MQRTSNNGTRRYPTDKHPAYHRTYDRLAKNSVFLNPEKRSNSYTHSGALSGIGNCKSSLAELEGNGDGMYHDDSRGWMQALIPSAKKQLNLVKIKIKRWQERRVQEGYTLKPNADPPDDLKEQLLKAQAVYDVRQKEKAVIENRIEELKTQRKEVPKEPMLEWGTIGRIAQDKRTVWSRNSDGMKARTIDRIVSVDGQAVSYSDSGIPFIDDADSPYDRMPLATYREMSKQWMKKNRIRRPDLLERKNQYIKAKKEAEEKIRPGFSVHHYESMLKRNGDWPGNPDWPEDAKPIDEIETVLD